jgi:hypothetical protein
MNEHNDLVNLYSNDGSVALLLFPQPHTRRVAIGKLDASFLKDTLDRREIIARRHAPSLFEIDDDSTRNHRAISQHSLVHIDEATGGAALGGRD